MSGERWPAIFVSHGAPTLPLEHSAAHDFLVELGTTLGRPQEILAVSAHWETAVPAVSAANSPQTLYDFYDFPEELYRLSYPAPGAPRLAARVAQLLETRGLRTRLDPERGFDHGAWTPLMLMYPDADVPVTQLSVQSRSDPTHHVRLGEALRPLRDENVLILASGSITHNLREFGNYRPDSEPPTWVTEFKEWLADALKSHRMQDLVAYRSTAPHAARNHPTEEHLLPLFVAAGAATPGGNVQRLHSGVSYGVIGMDAYRFD